MKTALFVLLAGLAAASAHAQSSEPATPPAAPAEPASATAATPVPATEPTPAEPDAPATVISGDRVADAAGDKRRCIRDTGTRLRKRDAHGCTGAPGESYDREAIDRTGAVDTADALRKLTTSGTVRRGH